jgi:hypothetical protein
MALTIHQQPVNTWSAAFAPMAFTLSSTNSSQSQFNFVCDVFHWPSGVKTLLGRLRAPAINGVGVFDVAGLVSSTLDPIPHLGAGLVEAESFYCQWSVDFYEEFDSTGGLGFPVLDEASKKSFGDVDATPAQDIRLAWAGADNSVAAQEGGPKMKFLLSHPRDRSVGAAVGIPIRMDERSTLMWLQPEFGFLPFQANVLAYDESGALLWERKFDMPESSANTKVWGFGCGPLQINEAALAVGEAFPPINSAVAHYEIQLWDGSFYACSEKVRFDIDRRSLRVPTRRVLWLNRFGGVDSMSFGYSEQLTADRDTYVTGDWALAGTTFSQRATQSSLVQTAAPRVSAEFVSNLMTERAFNALKGLAVSPRIWVNEPRQVLRVIATDPGGTAESCVGFTHYAFRNGTQLSMTPTSQAGTLVIDADLTLNGRFIGVDVFNLVDNSGPVEGQTYRVTMVFEPAPGEPALTRDIELYLGRSSATGTPVVIPAGTTTYSADLEWAGGESGTAGQGAPFFLRTALGDTLSWQGAITMTVSECEPGTDYAMLCDDDMESINRLDRDDDGKWYWVGDYGYQWEDASAWTTPSETEPPAGYAGFVGVPPRSCLYRMDWNGRELKRIAPRDLQWSRPKDNARQFTFKADLPAGESQWR